ncbi:hypothetical protein FIBSPDRAFT_994659 [Athelia psychrophila]|uniref:Uncharacterized protein n=1 Tax=Athelia psychrophila TaxID=1759441 RepID=A0A165XR38_9AGAM|nr:hypothetical protein FIBSPDRAFT_994659 [Fibularhizoctonia sp. CBS 109695]
MTSPDTSGLISIPSGYSTSCGGNGENCLTRAPFSYASTSPLPTSKFQEAGLTASPTYVLGELDKKGPSPQPDHFIIVSLLAGRLCLKKYFVAKYTGLGIDLLANGEELGTFRPSNIDRKGNAFSGISYLDEGVIGAEGKVQDVDGDRGGRRSTDERCADHGLTNESGDPVALRISIKLDLIFEEHAEFMKTVDEDMLRLAKINGAGGAQVATGIGGQLGTVLQKIVPIINTFAGVHIMQTHPILNAAWAVLSSVYKLVDILREMAGVATSCPSLREIRGTVNIIEEIGGKPSILARAAELSTSNIPSQVEECRKRCVALILTLHARVQFDMNMRVRGIQDTQKENDIHKWMCAPDSSPNYNAARDLYAPYKLATISRATTLRSMIVVTPLEDVAVAGRPHPLGDVLGKL